MADLEPILPADVEDLRDLLDLVARLDFEGVEVADLGTLAGDDANAAVSAINSVFGLLDLVDQQAATITNLQAEAVVSRRPPDRQAKPASGSDLWGQRRRRAN